MSVFGIFCYFQLTCYLKCFVFLVQLTFIERIIIKSNENYIMFCYLCKWLAQSDNREQHSNTNECRQHRRSLEFCVECWIWRQIMFHKTCITKLFSRIENKENSKSDRIKEILNCQHKNDQTAFFDGFA